MISFKKHEIKNGSLMDLTIHLFPSILVIILFEITAIEVYLHALLFGAKAKFFVWQSAQAVGGFALGYLSDKFCRKRIFVATQVIGVLILPVLLWENFSVFPLFLIGLFFNPSPVARAALIDNFPRQSKAKLIAITYIAQFLPWCFYLMIHRLDLNELMIFIILFLIFNSIFSYLFFEDRRDLSKEPHIEISKKLMHRKSSKRVLYTLSALLPGQLVFFISDTSFGDLASNAGLFTALGIGSLLGVIVGIFYRKIPHLSLLTFCFGIGILLSAVPLLTNYLASHINIYLPYQLMLFSTLGGFYLPFVFDVVLSATSSSYRGTACGIIDLVISLASVIGVSIVIFLNPSENHILLITVVLFIIAAVIQKKGEKYV